MASVAISPAVTLDSATLNPQALEKFTPRLLAWFVEHGRHDLPWQTLDDPYKVWVSEIMLQQTQVKTVLAYFEPFMQRFPTVFSLAAADWDEVAPYWAGLGYYARARNLHKAAGQVVLQYGNAETLTIEWPLTLDKWLTLSGIGPSTAGAILALGLHQFGVIMDGNVKRVLCRVFGIWGDTQKPVINRLLWSLAEQLTPQQAQTGATAAYTQAIMDLGATLCTPKKVLCMYCPMQDICTSFNTGHVYDLPQKFAKKPNPTRAGWVIIIQNSKGEWLWQQRPPSGLWGGLWTVPITEEAPLINQLLKQFPQTQVSPKQAQLLYHGFTHFNWELQPIIIELKPRRVLPKIVRDLLTEFGKQTGQIKNNSEHSLAPKQPIQWLTPTAASSIGIPKAMQQLIKQQTAHLPEH